MPATSTNDFYSRKTNRGFNRRTSMVIQVIPAAASTADSRHDLYNTPYSVSSYKSPMLTPTPTPAAMATPTQSRTYNPFDSHMTPPSPTAMSSHFSPRSMNRRQSIALQSSFSSHHMSMAPSPQLHPLPRPHTVYEYMANSPHSYLNSSIRSMSHVVASREAAAAAEEAALRELKDHRRSAAYERYPPLGSIFEGLPCSTGSVHLGSLESARNSDYFQHSSLPLDADERDAAADFAGQRSMGSVVNHNLITANGFDSGDQDGVVESRNGVRSLRGQGMSSASLASSVFSVSSISSSSSSGDSSYAYIFDSARRPLTTIDSSSDLLETRHTAGTTRKASGRSSSRNRNRSRSRIRGQPSFTANRHSVDNFFLQSSATLFMMDSIAASTAGQMDSACLGDTERTPLLLSRNHRTSVAGSTFASFGDDTTQQTAAIVTREAKVIFNTSSYILIGSLLQAIISMSQIASSGHLGRNELGGIGLAHMVVILTGYPVLFSVLSCLETCASQAYTSVQPQLVGAYFVQAMQVQWVMGLVLGALWFSAEPLLTHFMHGTNPEMVAMAAAYLRWYFVPFMLFGTLMCAKQLLFSQGVTYPLPYLTLLGTVVTLSAQYLFVFSPYFSLGVRGIALANGLSYLAMLLATFWVVRRHNVSRIWGGLRVRAPWKSFLRLMPPSLVLTVLSTGTSELITMAATQLGGSSLTIQAVISALSRMFMIASSSIGVAALNRAGNLIGHRSVRGAKISSTVSLCLGLIFAFLGAFAILWSPDTWIRIFTNDEQTVQGAKEILPVAIVGFAAQSLAFVCSQLLSAQGKQALAMRIKFVMLYVVGLPLGYYWAIASGHGLVGLWSAVAVGQTCTALVEAVVILKTDWVRLVDYCTETIIMP